MGVDNNLLGWLVVNWLVGRYSIGSLNNRFVDRAPQLGHISSEKSDQGLSLME